MNYSYILRIAVAAFAATLSFGAPAFDAAEVENSFFPYKTWDAEYPGYEPGMVINQENVEQFEEILDPGMFDHLKNGRFEMQTVPTGSLELHPNYIQATRDASTNAPVLNASGIVENFVAGRPFPSEPDLNDPNAGIKLAWNYQYGYNWGDNADICPFFWKYRNMKTGKLERTLQWCFRFLNWKHRVNTAPVPELPNNTGELFRSVYAIALEPFDLKDTQLLIHRYKDDLKRDDAWLYLGFQRRVRRLATGQTTDSFLGTDIMIEDFEGYNNRVSDYDWKYVDTKNVFLPFHRHNSLALTEDHKETDGYQYVEYGGQGNCFAQTTWELRKVYRVEATPKDKNHPLSRRVMNIDAQTFTLPQSALYDRKGDFWKTFSICQAYPDEHHPLNKGSGVAIDDCFMVIDVQAQHCTTGQFKGLLVKDEGAQARMTVQYLRKAGK
jgi:hypothetical protein